MHMICTILLATFVTPLVKTASQLVLHGNVFFSFFIFCSAMLCKRGLCRCKMSVCSSVYLGCPSDTGIGSKRLNVSPTNFHPA